MTQNQNIFEQAKKVSLETVAMGYVPLRKNGPELAGPCPHCGGRDRFHITRDRTFWGCRQCQNHGDVIDLVALVENVSKLQAAEKLVGGTSSQFTRKQHAPVSAPAPELFLEDNWQQKAIDAINKASAMLTPNSEGMAYLESRCITHDTASKFQLGFDPAKYCPITKRKRPAILLPWVIRDASGPIVTAIKYRFIDASSSKERFCQMAGSQSRLFGVGATPPNPTRLIVCEGEFNAATLAQTFHPQGYECVSIGSASASAEVLTTVRTLAHVRGYAPSHILVWCDTEQDSRRLADSLKCRCMKSPRGMDANDIFTSHGAEALEALIHHHLPPHVHTQEAPTLDATQPPPHLRGKIAHWNKDTARANAWSEWVLKHSKRTDAPEFATTEQAMLYVFKQWGPQYEQYADIQKRL